MIVKQTTGIRGHRFHVCCTSEQGSNVPQCLLSASVFLAPHTPSFKDVVQPVKGVVTLWVALQYILRGNKLVGVVRVIATNSW